MKIIIAIRKFIFGILKKITPASIRKKIKENLIQLYSLLLINNYNSIDNKNNKELRIAIVLQGGLEDVLISNAWIKEMYNRMNLDMRLDLFISADHSFLFYKMPYKFRIFNKEDFYSTSSYYDLKIELYHFVNIISISLYRIRSKNKNLYNLLTSINKYNYKYRKFCYNQPQCIGELADLILKQGKNRWTQLNMDGLFDFNCTYGNVQLNESFYSIMDKLDLRNKRYITIHADSDLNENSNLHQIKQWSCKNYEELCELIKNRYPDLTIVQIGADNSLHIINTDNCFNNLSMNEIMIVLKNSLLHIDSDSDLVHIRRQLSGKSIVLFGPTPVNYFKYDENININSPFYCTNCMWMMDDWEYNCNVFSAPYPAKCMEAITPQMVMREFTDYMDKEYK